MRHCPGPSPKGTSDVSQTSVVAAGEKGHLPCVRLHRWGLPVGTLRLRSLKVTPELRKGSRPASHLPSQPLSSRLQRLPHGPSAPCIRLPPPVGSAALTPALQRVQRSEAPASHSQEVPCPLLCPPQMGNRLCRRGQEERGRPGLPRPPCLLPGHHVRPERPPLHGLGREQCPPGTRSLQLWVRVHFPSKLSLSGDGSSSARLTDTASWGRAAVLLAVLQHPPSTTSRHEAHTRPRTGR